MKKNILFGGLLLAMSVANGANADLVNSGFEYPVINTTEWGTVAASTPGFGWKTTSPDGLVEIWHDQFLDVPAYEGLQFAELNGFYVSSLYQDISGIAANATIGWSFAHRGRLGDDTLRLTITDLGTNTVAFTNTFTTGNNAWGLYTGGGIIASGNVYRFEYTSVSAAGGDQTFGNFLDDVHFGVDQGPGQVPEPATMLLMGAGFSVLAGLRLRKKNS